MKKKIVVSLVILMVVGAVFAYFQDKQTKRNDFMTYYNEEFVPVIGEEEEKMSDMPDKVENWEEKGEKQEIASYMKEETLPLAEESLKNFETIDPKNNTIKKLNQLTIEMEKQRIKVINTIIGYSEDKQAEEVMQREEEKLHNKADKVADYNHKLIERYNLKKGTTDKTGRLEKVEPK